MKNTCSNKTLSILTNQERKNYNTIKSKIRYGQYERTRTSIQCDAHYSTFLTTYCFYCVNELFIIHFGFSELFLLTRLHIALTPILYIELRVSSLLLRQFFVPQQSARQSVRQCQIKLDFSYRLRPFHRSSHSVCYLLLPLQVYYLFIPQCQRPLSFHLAEAVGFEPTKRYSRLLHQQ